LVWGRHSHYRPNIPAKQHAHNYILKQNSIARIYMYFNRTASRLYISAEQHSPYNTPASYVRIRTLGVAARHRSTTSMPRVGEILFDYLEWAPGVTSLYSFQ